MVVARALFAVIAMVKRNICWLQADGAYRELSSVWTYIVPDEVSSRTHSWCPFWLEARHGYESEFLHSCLVDVLVDELLHKETQGLKEERLMSVHFVLDGVIKSP